jgi:hypothetical protein
MTTTLNKNEIYNALNANHSDKIHISFSEFSLFNECGHKHLIFKYLKLDEQPPSIHLFFGNAIHAAIELSLNEGSGIEKRIEFFKNTFKKEMMDNMKDDPSFNEVDNFVAQGENILKTLSVEKIFQKYRIVSVEEALYENLHGKFFFKGFIDLVVQNKETGKYVIIDWKTSGEEWKLDKKLKDEIFLCQMRFYKYFWARKNKINLSDITCKYVVLNRLNKKNNAKSGFGKLQPVDINSTNEEIKLSLKKLANTIKRIHVEHDFFKIKHTGSEKMGCMFCKFKGGSHTLCNTSMNQYVVLLKENNNKIKEKI